VARIFAQAAGQVEAAQRRGYQDRAVQLLRQTLQQQSLSVRTAFWHKVVKNDRVWKGVQHHPEFRQLVGDFGQESR
jgi:hypothetical protein